jgi:hypothetical protein
MAFKFFRKSVFEPTSRMRETVSEAAPAQSSQEKMFAVKYEMQNCMNDFKVDEARRDRLQLMLEGAIDAQTLWSLRSDLMLFLSSHCGERAARDKLDKITGMFSGLVFDSQMPSKSASLYSAKHQQLR